MKKQDLIKFAKWWNKLPSYAIIENEDIDDYLESLSPATAGEADEEICTCRYADSTDIQWIKDSCRPNEEGRYFHVLCGKPVSRKASPPSPAAEKPMTAKEVRIKVGLTTEANGREVLKHTVYVLEKIDDAMQQFAASRTAEKPMTAEELIKEGYITYLERMIETCLNDKDLQREHWAFCQALKSYRSFASLKPTQVLDLFAVMPSLPVVDKGFGSSRPEQWVIDTHKEELEDLRYFRQRYFDFWEWYENNYPHTEQELWDEFEGNEA